ncbi:MAG: hypothetical protein LC798_19465 [Chloroflexi bacterium]|nr:hypothetical protein [Chloroflexota bacterium]
MPPTSSRTLAVALLTTCALGMAACGDDEPQATGSAAAPTATNQPAPEEAAERGSSETMSCPDVPVPGHLAEDVKATGLDCDATVPIANAAEGMGRAPYESGGFACEPTDAPNGKTTYSCTMGDAKLIFLYGQ